MGTASDESYTLEDDGDVVVGGLIFRSLTGVDAAGGSDTIALISLADATLNGTDGEASIRGLDFSNIESVTNGALVASDAGDRYLVTGADSIEANAIAFAGISSVTAGSGDDTATGLNGEDWSLNGSGGAVNNGITFANVETFVADAAGLVGTASDESYTLEDDGDVVIDGLTFRSLKEVRAGEGVDTVFASTATPSAGETNDKKKVKIGNIDFWDVEKIFADQISLSGDFDNILTIIGDGALTIDDIDYFGITSVDAAEGYDMLDAIGTVALNGETGQVRSAEIDFFNIEAVVNGTMSASDNGDDFVITGVNSIEANGIDFSGITTVTGGAGSDTVIGLDGENWSLNGASNPQNNGIVFLNVEEFYAQNAGLDGTASADLFELQGVGTVSYGGFTFKDVSSVDGGSGDDTLDTSGSGLAVTLTGNDFQLSAGGVDFYNIENAIAAALTGSAGADTFTVTGDNALDAWQIHFSGVSSVAADGDTLEGTAAGDVFTLDAAGAVSVAAMTFSNLSAVDGIGGSDSLDASAYLSGLSLTGNDNQLSAGSLVLSNIFSATVATLAGTAGADIFTLDATNNLLADEVAFSGVSAINAGGGLDLLQVSGDGRNFSVSADNALSFDGIDVTGLEQLENAGSTATATGASGADWSLGAIAGEAENSLVTFSGVQTLVANSAGLSGTAADENYSLEDDGDVVIHGLIFRSLAGVDAGAGADTIALVSTAEAVLSGNDGEATIRGIDFSSIEAVSNGTVKGSELDDRFEITGLNQVKANSIDFSAISSIDARGGQDSVTGDGSDWTLDDIIPELNSSGIEFTGVEQVAAAGAGLFGADSAETYALMGGGVVEVSGVTFGGLTFVNAGAGADELNAQAFTGDLALNGNNNELDADGLLFRSIDSVTADTLLGSSGNDNFAVAADGSVSVAGMLFASGIDSIDALDGTDHVEAAADVKLQGNSGKATISNINFTNIESASGTGVGVIATDGDDDFEILADGKIFTGGITIDGVTSIDALGGVDTVIGASGFDWLLLGSKQAENNGIAFGNVEELIAVNAGLQGTAGVDAFTLLSSGDVFVWDMTVSGMQWVHAGTGADSVNASDYSGGLALNGTDNEVSAGDLLFTGIESAVTATLTGSAGTDIFTVSGSGALSAALIDFSGIATLNGAATDAVESTVNDDWTIMADSSQVAHAGITFSGIEAFSGGGGTLRGNDSGADFSIDGSRAVSVGSLRFNDLDDVIAGAGDDTLAAMDSVTLLGAGGAFSSSDMTFSGFESVITADLIGSSGDDTFLMLANSSLSVYGLVISGVDTLDAGSGNDSVLGRSGRGYLLNIDNSVTHDGLVFHNVENFSGDSASLTTTSAAESLTMTADDALDIDSVGLSFSGLVAVDTGAGNDELAARGAVALHGTNTVTAGSIKFTNVDTVTNTGTLSGTAGSDQFAIAANNQLDSYGIRFEDVLAVAAAGGSDALTGLDSEAWQLSGANNTLSHAGIEFTSLETTSGGNGILNGSASADQFILTANNQVTANSITFTAITQVDAGAGVDTISSPDGETWALGNGTGSAAAAGIDFASIESVSGHASHVDAVTNNAEDNFVLSDKGSSLSARGIAFSSVASVVAGADSGDSISSNATDWQLTGTDGELIVNGVNLFGIDQVITADALLRGTANNETFALASDGELGIAGMAFDGIARVEAGGGNDVLQGTVAADNFELTSFGDISVAAIQFSGLERVAAGEGADTVSSSGASWTSVRSGDALVDGSAEATVDSITVLFEGLAGVSGTGAYTGQGIDGEYLFSSLDTMTIGGITFANLSSLTAGSGNDVLRGADIDGVWSVNAAGGNISTGGSSLSFSGVEAIVAGGGADQFTLSGGEFTSIHTGAGSDTVILAGTRLDSLSLGAGNDSLQVSADSSQDVTLSGGVGDDEFQFNIAGKTWQVTDADNRVGNFLFTGFEWLDNNSDGIKLETDRGFNFVNGGDSSASFNRNGAGILFADGMRLGYDGSGDIAITSTSSDTIGGDLQAGRADLIVAGNVDITSNVEVLNIQTAGADIDISVLAQDDLVIDEVNAGGGTITLNSAKFGSLTAETYGDTHLTAGKVTLGSELQQWSVIGSAINPLRMDVLKSVDIVSISYFEPDFIGQVPTLTARGDELESVAGAQAAQGLKSAVQNAVEDFAQVDPGIFSAVNPYSTGVDAVNSPEMQLTGDELLPLSVSGAPDQEDELPRRSAELEGSDDESPQEQPSQQGNRAPLAPEEVGG
ncbi:hypothetical protein [Microbulbifer marinus]|uniref:hypothetical protein n=1 Tax=Microbulbifer marinus TaxID=658218 RepID=UPI001B8D7319|nr:hypothetical protein [Microbulbifer marinus]